MRNVILHVALVVVTTISYAQPMTKEQISYEVQDAHNRLRSPIGSDDSCQAIASTYIDDLTESHDLFLKDAYYLAIIKALDVISISAKKSIGFPNCRSSIVTKIPHANLYLKYMLNQRCTPLPEPILYKKSSPSEGDKATLEALTYTINQRMVQACRASRCISQEILIGYKNNWIQKELMQKQPDYEAIAFWLSEIKGLIGTFNSDHISELNYIHEKNTLMLRIIQPYIFQSQDFFGTFNRTLVSHIIRESKPRSYCTYVLAQYLEMTISSSQSALDHLLVINNKLYERLDDIIYFREFYNTDCTISRDDLFNTPFVFTEQIKKQLYEL